MLSRMTQPAAGWYDDPQVPSQQRYWDGAQWTEHHRPLQGPPPYQGAYGGPQQQGFGYPAGYGQLVTASTPDGVRLSGWWKRVGARILDGLIVLVIGLPLTGYFYYKYLQVVFDWQQDLMDDAAAGRSNGFATLPGEAYQWMIPGLLIGLVIAMAYEVFFLTRSGATPGKKVLDISVRLRDVPGPPAAAVVVKRYGVICLLGLAGAIPVAGSIVGLVALLNYLWPLWDSKKQALHDKAAQTNVVEGQQVPRRLG